MVTLNQKSQLVTVDFFESTFAINQKEASHPDDALSSAAGSGN